MNKTNTVAADELCPVNLADALKLLKDGFKPVAGGSDLMIRRHVISKSESHSLGSNISGGFKPVFYAGKIKELCIIEQNGDILKIGSSVSLNSIIKSPFCPSVLSEALLSIASPGIRNAATLTGNICNASPAGDSLPPLYILDAVIEAASLNKKNTVIRRKIPIREFITGPGRTVLRYDELVTFVNIPLKPGYRSCFKKLGTRAANALSKLSIGALWKTENGKLSDFRLAVGACGPTVIRCDEAERMLIEDFSRIDEVLALYSADIRPIDDQRSTAEYRKNTALKLIKKIILDTKGGKQ
jgi:CO/xanthine dehydrogenase FAD-binding subunit